MAKMSAGMAELEARIRDLEARGYYLVKFGSRMGIPARWAAMRMNHLTIDLNYQRMEGLVKRKIVRFTEKCPTSHSVSYWKTTSPEETQP